MLVARINEDGSKKTQKITRKPKRNVKKTIGEGKYKTITKK